MKLSIAKSYNKIAKEYTKQYGYDEHRALPSLKKYLKLLSLNANILDIGCGGGQDSRFFSLNGLNISGIDISSKMIKLSKEYCPQGNFKVIDLMKISSENKYDALWCCRVFQHISLSKQNKFLKKMAIYILHQVLVIKKRIMKHLILETIIY